MKDRKVILGLLYLSVYELNSFSKYVHSPYFNVNLGITKYFDILEKAIKNDSVDHLQPKIIWDIIYPDLTYHNQKFLKLNSDLLILLESFMAQKEFDASESLQANLKLEGARKRNAEKLYNGIIADIERLQKTEINQSAEFYLNKYLIERNLFNLKTENEKKNEKVEISAELNIKAISDNLDYFYVAEKLRIYCTLLSWEKMYKLDILIENLEYILTIAKSKNYLMNPAIQLYYSMHLTYLEEGNVENYYNLRNLMKQYLHIFPIHEQKEIYSTALNYCINKINKNQTEFFRETFELYKEGIESEHIFQQGELIPTMFRNIVISALRVAEFDWAEDFILEYAKYVEEKFRINAVEFSMARLEFYRKDFGKVLEHLYRVSYEDVWYNINAKTLQLASYYELDEYDALESLLQAFKMYIRREKSLSADRKVHYNNLIKFTSSLMRINPKDQEKVIKLKDEIINTKGVVSKPWLIEKVDEMIKKK